MGIARRKSKIEQLAKKLQNKSGELFPVKCDITVESDIIKAFTWTTETLGPISILINNAGIYKHIHLSNSPTDDFKEVWDTNVLGVTIATREAVKNMRENKTNGHIVHISSVAAYKNVFLGSGAYCASKHALRCLTEALRQELNSYESKIKISVSNFKTSHLFICTLASFIVQYHNADYVCLGREEK